MLEREIDYFGPRIRRNDESVSSTVVSGFGGTSIIAPFQKFDYKRMRFDWESIDKVRCTKQHVSSYVD